MAYPPVNLVRAALGNYLDLSLSELQEMKYRHDTCSRCINHGIHIYYMYAAPEFEQIARRQLTTHQLAVLDATPVYHTGY